MTTEERHYSNHGAVRSQVKPSGHRRAFHHDYHEVGTYMITLATDGRQRLFGHIEGSAFAARKLDRTAWVHDWEAPHIVLSELGRRILEEEVPKISRFYPQVEVWRVAMMPDHIHLLIRVKEHLPPGKHLGSVIRGFKTGCSRAWWALQDAGLLPLVLLPHPAVSAPSQPAGQPAGTVAPRPASVAVAPGPPTGAALSQPAVQPAGTVAPTAGRAAAVPVAFPTGATPSQPAVPAPSQPAVQPAGTMAPTAGRAAAVPVASPTGSPPLRPLLFEAGYHDRIISRPGMLENIKRYMLENPLRARIREECPHLMERRLHLWISGREYAAFGNLFLLKYPVKEQVFFHRFTPVDEPERQSILAANSLTDKEREHISHDPARMPTHLTAAYAAQRARLLRAAEEGTVLVTPGISKGESLVANDAIDAGLPLILLQARPIGKYWKPEQRRFFACATGRLLILSPWELDGVTDYEHFHRLNDLAQEICNTTETRIMDYHTLTQVRDPNQDPKTDKR